MFCKRILFHFVSKGLKTVNVLKICENIKQLNTNTVLIEKYTGFFDRDVFFKLLIFCLPYGQINVIIIADPKIIELNQ